jgi:hypothetical protein
VSDSKHQQDGRGFRAPAQYPHANSLPHAKAEWHGPVVS